MQIAVTMRVTVSFKVSIVRSDSLITFSQSH